jgi:hypothetical protein
VSCNNYSNALLPNDKKFAEYIYKWHTESPMLGRETTQQFMHKSVKIDAEMINKYNERLTLLDDVDLSNQNESIRQKYNYYKNYEHFTRSIIQDQLLIDSINKNIQVMDKNHLIGLVNQINAKETIKKYVKTITSLKPTRGGKAILLSLNLRWLPDYCSVRQLLGLEPSLIDFQPTNYESLAQLPGEYTFYIDDKDNTWLCAGEKETGFKAFNNKEGQSYVLIDSTFDFDLTTIRRIPLLPGKYRLTLNSNTMDYKLTIHSKGKPVACSNDKNVFEFKIRESGAVMRLSPKSNNLKIYSLIIEQL